MRILIISIAIFAFGACSSNGRTTTTEQSKPAGAMTSGISGQQQFAGTDVAVANKLRASYDQVYYFNFNKDSVHQNDMKSIDVQANYLVAHPNTKVRLDGNTDERGSREYNVALAWRRAKAVASVLKQQGVAPNQIVMNSYGEEKPVAFCHQEKCYKLNRRVNLTYEAK